MILVTLGTQDKSFTRLLKAVEEEIKKGTITEKVIVQAGYTKYKSEVMEIFELIPKDKFESLLGEASLVITHGGVGNILTALEKGKVIIAAPRLAKYKEHTNDHQKEIIDEFEKRGYILALKDFTKLEKLLAKSKTFTPRKYESNKEHFQKLIASYIEETDHISWYNQDKRMILASFMNFLFFFLAFTFYPNIYIVSSLSFVVTIILSYFLKVGKINQPLVVSLCFYMLEILLLLLLFQQLSLNIIMTKLMINTIFVFLYHYLRRKSR